MAGASNSLDFPKLGVLLNSLNEAHSREMALAQQVTKLETRLIKIQSASVVKNGN